MGGDVQERKTCRLCGSTALELRFSLGSTPPANEFLTKEEIGKSQEVFPLDVVQCASCGHIALKHVVNPERLFRNYVYVSGTSPTFVEHFRQYAATVIERMQLKAPARVVEIGSNDGTLLRFFKEAGFEVLGIDPARAIAEAATSKGIRTLPEFFDQTLAERLIREEGEAAVVVANNVYAHADDLEGIARGIRQMLSKEGLFVFEVSYWVDVIEQRLFDTIYHEHVSYHSLKPLLAFFDRLEMEVIDVERVKTHGGSIRVYVQKRGGGRAVSESVQKLVRYEEAMELYGVACYERYVEKLQNLKRELHQVLRGRQKAGKRIVGFGAPAKTTTLMSYFGLDRSLIDYLIDDSPLKQGLYSPGFHLPVVSSDCMKSASNRPDTVLIFAWNFADSIIQKHEGFLKEGGEFVVPIPEVRVVAAGGK